jgi:hypothetical protein
MNSEEERKNRFYQGDSKKKYQTVGNTKVTPPPQDERADSKKRKNIEGRETPYYQKRGNREPNDEFTLLSFNVRGLNKLSK